MSSCSRGYLVQQTDTVTSFSSFWTSIMNDVCNEIVCSIRISSLYFWWQQLSKVNSSERTTNRNYCKQRNLTATRHSQQNSQRTMDCNSGLFYCMYILLSIACICYCLLAGNTFIGGVLSDTQLTPKFLYASQYTESAQNHFLRAFRVFLHTIN